MSDMTFANGSSIESVDAGTVYRRETNAAKSVQSMIAALEAVGISIRDENGKLKSTGDILRELGQKWDELEKRRDGEA